MPEHADYLSRLSAHTHDLFVVADLDGRLKFINPAWQQTLGFSLAELYAEPLYNFVHPDDVDRTHTERELLAGGGDTLLFENRYRCKDGSYRRLQWNGRGDMEGRLVYGFDRLPARRAWP